ncbi:MAG: Hsp70 family protein [Myxococcales bacterium FL481]|nr:MAG: Hsp70 family protein [Myxococcales bacterium FL481]
MSSAPKFAIGIDLGTTNCTLASTSLDDRIARPTPLDVPQVSAPGEVSRQPLLPSFLYRPAQVEFPEGAMALPWNAEATDAVGSFARRHGAATPVRLVSSAKSWLSHAGVDRRADILPWGAPDEVDKLSPVEASARYLAHLRASWDAAHPDEPLADQSVVLTVPASFDAVARELTVEAAARAGLSETPRLLEEPQAAMYAWLAGRGNKWRDELSVGDVVLVIDIGGGTTDFSLISVTDREGDVELERIAVGDHILLGGDNIDLALAHTVRAELKSSGTELDDWQMRALTHGCREGKEALLGDAPAASYPLVVPGRGSQLIGGSIRAELSRHVLEQVVLDGFFPRVAADAVPTKPRRLGLQSVGLPFAHDAGITRHLAAFLGRVTDAEGAPIRPTAILFNGGVTRSTMLRDRIHAVVGSWSKSAGGAAPRLLSGADADLAVGRGAAYYAHARAHGGLRIRSGTAMAYYIGLERAELAVPGIEPAVDAVCVAPFGMEEGSDVALDDVFGLVLGEPVAFRFFGSPSRPDDNVGSVVDPEGLTELPPIEIILDGDAGSVVHVQLHASVTEVGMLELAAVEQGGERRWKLSFSVRLE